MDSISNELFPKPLTESELIKEFCDEAGIKPIKYILFEPNLNEYRLYSSRTALYKKPSGWGETELTTLDTPIYPDLINDPENFLMVLNLQWDMFEELGDVYQKERDESFQYNYLNTKLKALKMCKSFGGGEMMEEYKKELRKLNYGYDINNDINNYSTIIKD